MTEPSAPQNEPSAPTESSSPTAAPSPAQAAGSAQPASLSLVGQIVRRGIPLLVLVGVLYAAYHFFESSSMQPDHAAGNAPAPPAMPVTVIETKAETVPLLSRFLGQTEASRLVEIRSRVGGQIESRSFTEGALVREGDELFQIDPKPFEATLAQAKARQKSSEAVAEQTKLMYDRVTKLAQEAATSQTEVDNARANYEVALADVQLQVELVAAAKLDLDYATITSPVNGRIGQIVTEVGNYVAPGGQQTLITVQTTDPIYVRFPVTEREWLTFQRELESGSIESPPIDRVELEITLADDTTFSEVGHINFQDVRIDQNTGTMVVRGTVPNPDGRLVPGQLIHVTAHGPQRVGVIAVPQAAVLHSPMGASVYVVNSENIVEARPVTLGDWTSGDRWIIRQGLEAGEKVVVDRLMMLRPNTPVIPQLAGAAGEPAEQQQAEQGQTAAAVPPQPPAS